MMLHTKYMYQGASPCGFGQEEFLMFSYKSLCETCDPRMGPFWLQGHNLHKIGRGQLGDGT